MISILCNIERQQNDIELNGMIEVIELITGAID